MSYPQPYPKEIYEVVKDEQEPRVFAIAAQPNPTAKPMVMFLTIGPTQHAKRVAVSKDLKIRSRIISHFAEHGALLAIEMVYQSSKTAASFYSTLDPLDPFDLNIINHLLEAEQVAIGWGDYEGQLQWVTVIEWDATSRQIVEAWLHEAAHYSSKSTKSKGYDFDKAVKEFDRYYDREYGSDLPKYH